MSNGNLPAYPVSCVDADGCMTGTQAQISGLTKRELFCLHNSVADTGDNELDEIINQGNRQKAGVAVMQGLLGNSGIKLTVGVDCKDNQKLADVANSVAAAVMIELERTK